MTTEGSDDDDMQDIFSINHGEHIFHDNEPETASNEDEAEECDEMSSNLNKISWLPSVRLGKQLCRTPPRNDPPYPSLSSRQDDADRGPRESLDNGASPPACRSVEILPVLPMNMVHGWNGPSDDPKEGGSRDISDVLGGYGSGVWEDESSALVAGALGPVFSGTSSYLPHTRGHVFTVAEPRYKRLYDDLLRMGSYYGKKRESALRRAKQRESEGGAGLAVGTEITPSLPNPDEKRRFIVTAVNPREEGVFAEYGVLFQLRDLDEVAAVSSLELGESLTLEDLHELMDARDEVYDDEDDENDDIMEALLQTHYEATHDVVGRVKIHRFLNPECWDDGPDGEEYLMAEATILDVVEDDRAKMLEERRRRQQTVGKETKEQAAGLADQQAVITTTTKVAEQAKLKAYGDVARAVARIKEELHTALEDTFKQQHEHHFDPDRLKDELRTALNEAHGVNSKFNSTRAPQQSNRSKSPTPIVPKRVLVERKADDSLIKEERALRESFAQLVSLQHELREECRFTRLSIQTFGIGPVGVWLSAAAWSQFIEKRLEASHANMQSDLQAKLAEYLANKSKSGRGSNEIGGLLRSDYEEENDDSDNEEDSETIDFEELSPELQREFQLVQARAAEEFGPLALERAIQMQRLVQADSYVERLNLLRECVDVERRRLEAKKMLRLALNSNETDNDQNGNQLPGRLSREDAMAVFERLMVNNNIEDMINTIDHDEDGFQ